MAAGQLVTEACQPYLKYRYCCSLIYNRGCWHGHDCDTMMLYEEAVCHRLEQWRGCRVDCEACARAHVQVVFPLAATRDQPPADCHMVGAYLLLTAVMLVVKGMLVKPAGES